MIELQKIDCNCNDCIFMIRDIEKKKSFDYLHKGQEKASHRLSYGYCVEFAKNISFIPNICQPQTQYCFQHRKG